jgi:hypothetical protein
MRRISIAIIALCFAVGCTAGAVPPKTPGIYLFVWAGDKDDKASDFLGVIDADPASAAYGSIVASLPVGESGTHPHHTEHVMPATQHLLANGFHAGRTWAFDLTDPRRPRILSSFGGLAGFSHPHTFVRLPNGHLLATFQYKADQTAPAPTHGDHSDRATAGAAHTTGGLVELDERGQVTRSGAANDASIADSYIYPYFALPVPALDRIVSTTTDMDAKNVKATSQWVQFWRLSDLKLLRTIELKPGPGGKENQFTGEVRLLRDGKSVYVHTFQCGLYLVRGIDQPDPAASFVHAFPGAECGVPLLTSHYWVQPVPEAHAVVVLDITDPEHPREVSTVTFGDDEKPHWLAIDTSGRRMVVNSGGMATGNRLFVLNFDPATGALAIDEKFREPGSTTPGVNLTGLQWPHGFSGTAAPHGTVFSR